MLHCGTSTAGFYLGCLVAVDVAAGWVELEPVWGLTQEHVRAAVARLLRRTPHQVHHWHTDNDVAFLNGPLLDYCRRHGITGEPGSGFAEENDQAYVEQRNSLAVRPLVGRDRYISRAAFHLFRRLYPLLRVQLNFLPAPPQARGTAPRRRAHPQALQPAATPYQRLLAAGVLTPAQRGALADQFRAVNPATLAAQIQTCLDTLWRLARTPARHHDPWVTLLLRHRVDNSVTPDL